MDSALTQNIISEACVSQPPISTNTTGSLSHKYRRRRKVENGRRLSNFCIVQRSILIFVCAMASVQAFSSAIFTGRRSLLRSQAPSKYHHLSPFSCKPAPSRIASTTLFSSDGEDESSKEEWQAILAAFQMYKAAYGNLKVPLRFVVPALAPWPGLSKNTMHFEHWSLLYKTYFYIVIVGCHRKSVGSQAWPKGCCDSFHWKVRP